MRKIFYFLTLGLFLACQSPKEISQELKILESYSLDIPEISGLSWRQDPHRPTEKQLVIVTDKKNEVYLLNWGERNLSLNLKKIDLNLMSKKWESIHFKGQWESVYADESGRIFLLQEHPTQIVVLNSELTEIELVISLEINAELKKELLWDEHPNSQGEGVLLLKNGHVLVSKEKKPMRLMEFLPQGHTAQGFMPALSLEQEGQFPLPKDQKLFAQKVWKMSDELEKKVVDVSGVNIGAFERLFLLSDQGRSIIEIENQLSVNQTELKLKNIIRLPKQLKKAEGMVLDENNRPIVAIDAKIKKNEEPKKNLFLLEPIP